MALVQFGDASVVFPSMGTRVASLTPAGSNTAPLTLAVPYTL